MKEPEVHLPASAVFPEEEREIAARGGNLGFTGFAITNSMLSSWLTTLVLIVIFVVAASRKKLVPGRLQGFAEVIVEGLLNFVEGVSGKGMARAFFPIIATIFLFVLFNAWMGLLPIYPSLGFNSSEEANADYIAKAKEGKAMHLHGTIASVSDSGFTLKDGTVFHLEAESAIGEELAKGCSPAPCMSESAVGKIVKFDAVKSGGELIVEHAEKGKTPRIDLLRPAGTDVNMPLALAVVAFLFVEIWGLRRLGFGYLAKFFRFKTLIKGAEPVLQRADRPVRWDTGRIERVHPGGELHVQVVWEYAGGETADFGFGVPGAVCVQHTLLRAGVAGGVHSGDDIRGTNAYVCDVGDSAS